MSEQSYQLTVRKGPQSQIGQSYPLLGQTITLGRDSIADIVITDPEVSRQHVRLTETDEGYEIQDLGSTNGTFVDGRRLGGAARLLAEGQVVSLGSNVALIFEPAARPEATILAAERDFSLEDEDEAVEEVGKRGVGIYDVPALEEPGGVVAEEVVAEDADTTFTFEEEVDFGLPSFDEVHEEDDEFGLPSFDEADEEDDDFGLPSFDQTEEEVFEAPSFNQAPDLDDDLENEGPQYDAYDDDEALPDFATPVADDYPAPRKIAAGRDEPPPPLPPAGKAPGNNRNRNLIIAAVVIGLLLCCCCLMILLWYTGDGILTEFNYY